MFMMRLVCGRNRAWWRSAAPVALALVSSLAGAKTFAAGAPTALFEPVNDAPVSAAATATSGPSGPLVKLTLSPDALRAAESLEVDAGDGPPLVAWRERVDSIDAAHFDWIGRIEGDVPGRAIVLYRDGRVNGSFIAGPRAVRIMGSAGGRARLVSSDGDEPAPGCGLSQAGEAADHDDAGEIALFETEVATCGQFCQNRDFGSDDGSELTLVVLFTAAARDYFAPVDIRDVIETTVGDINDMIFPNSGIADYRIRLVHVQEVSYTEADPPNPVVDRIALETPFDGLLEEAHELRNRFCADHVQLWVGAASATVAGTSNPLTGCARSHRKKGFSAVAAQYVGPSVYATAHEIGHWLGADHSREQTPCTSLGDFNHGYFRDSRCGRFRTIMSNNTSYPKIAHFSNPLVSYCGVPTGVAPGTTCTSAPGLCPGDTENCSADNVCMILDTRELATNARDNFLTLAAPPGPEQFAAEALGCAPGSNLAIHSVATDIALHPGTNPPDFRQMYLYSRSCSDGTESELRAVIYRGDGSLAATIPAIETGSENTEGDVAATADGRFVVASFDGEEIGGSIRVRAYDTDGMPLWGPVSLGYVGGLSSLRVAPRHDGAVVVAYSALHILVSPPSLEQKLMTQVFLPDGSLEPGGPHLITSIGVGAASIATLAADPGPVSSSEYFVAWESSASGAPQVELGRFAGDGTPLWPAPIQVSTLDGAHARPDVVVDGSGNVLVSWLHQSLSSERHAVHRRATTDGVFLDSAERFASELPGVDVGPRAAGLPDGFLLMWLAGTEVKGRRYDAHTAQPVGPEFALIQSPPPAGTRETAHDALDVAYRSAASGNVTEWWGLGAMSWGDLQAPGDDDAVVVGRRFRHCETTFEF